MLFIETLQNLGTLASEKVTVMETDKVFIAD